MVEVFKTNVEHEHQAMVLEQMLTQHFPLLRVDFDIEDCDRILRVEGATVATPRIIELMTANGYHCHILE
ncbi:MAG: hypothetical protein JWQ38_1725 [Flavipsychrobacter sp.]|nr:hypothetical protein [Flavipsychrobacter sp.]